MKPREIMQVVCKTQFLIHGKLLMNGSYLFIYFFHFAGPFPPFLFLSKKSDLPSLALDT